MPYLEPVGWRVPSAERCRVEMLRLGWRKYDDDIWRHTRMPEVRISDGFVSRHPSRALREARRVRKAR